MLEVPIPCGWALGPPRRRTRRRCRDEGGWPRGSSERRRLPRLGPSRRRPRPPCRTRSGAQLPLGPARGHHHRRTSRRSLSAANGTRSRAAALIERSGHHEHRPSTPPRLHRTRTLCRLAGPGPTRTGRIGASTPARDNLAEVPRGPRAAGGTRVRLGPSPLRSEHRLQPNLCCANRPRLRRKAASCCDAVAR